MSRQHILHLKKLYPAGTRVVLTTNMDDARPICSGEKGTVRTVDDIGTIHVDWDSGRRLGLMPEIDSFKVISCTQ
mgnify:CR=1 FL=1